MKVKLIRIDTAGHELPSATGSFDVRVLVEVDGEPEWHVIHVKPRALPGFDASLLAASAEFQARLKLEQYALHRICKLVGQELRGRSVRLPQQIAA